MNIEQKRTIAFFSDIRTNAKLKNELKLTNQLIADFIKSVKFLLSTNYTGELIKLSQIEPYIRKHTNITHRFKPSIFQYFYHSYSEKLYRLDLIKEIDTKSYFDLDDYKRHTEVFNQFNECLDRLEDKQTKRYVKSHINELLMLSANTRLYTIDDIKTGYSKVSRAKQYFAAAIVSGVFQGVFNADMVDKIFNDRHEAQHILNITD